MQDGIIKSTGNSRYLKSVANFLTLYPTYEKFAQALIAGNLPIDLNGINPSGWSTQGTALNKATLLKDATAALYGKNSSAVPDDIFAAIQPVLASVQTDSENSGKIYLTEVVQIDKKIKIIVPGTPVFFFAYGTLGTTSYVNFYFGIRPNDYVALIYTANGTQGYAGTNNAYPIVWGANTITIDGVTGNPMQPGTNNILVIYT